MMTKHEYRNNYYYSFAIATNNKNGTELIFPIEFDKAAEKGQRFSHLKYKHQVALIFVHKIGTNYSGKIIKARRNLEKFEKVTQLDEVLKCFNHLPRKMKKSIKNNIQNKINEYKKEF